MARQTLQNGANSQPSVLEDLQALDIRELKRFGFLDTGSRATVRWKLRDQANGQTDITCVDGVLQLHHRCRAYDDRWETAHQCVALDYTIPPFGGLRPWFVCPDCGHRCAKLYFDRRFRCRTCTGLLYYCQRVDEQHRLLARIIGIREQLDGIATTGDFIPKRPNGMHRSRYRKLVRRHDELCAKLNRVELTKYAETQN